ncbi:hypothetical protein XENOCAPTIV_003791, partial [Xenoophorus captivus]
LVANQVSVKGASNCLKVSLASWVEPAQDEHTHITIATPHRAFRTCTAVTLMQQCSLRLPEADSAPAALADCASMEPTTFSLVRSSPVDRQTYEHVFRYLSASQADVFPHDVKGYIA